MITITLYEWLIILIIHHFADFVFQTSWQATNKWHSTYALLCHTLTYGLWTFIGYGMWFLIEQGHRSEPYDILMKTVYMTTITFVIHTIQDFITSKFTHTKFEAKEYNGLWGGFTLVNLDQILHYIQLIITYKSIA